MEKLTLETLPNAFTLLSREIGEIKELLQQLNYQELLEPDRWFDLNDFCEYHPDKPSKATVYGWVSAKTIPVHKTGKKLRFLKSEIDEWLLQGKKRTYSDALVDASNYLPKRKGGACHE
jgi:excisionase family DNA binding protein